MPTTLSIDDLISARARSIDLSGIRKVFELGARLEDPINLSIGQPDFPVPRPLKDAAIAAIENDRNGYTLTQGTQTLRAVISRRLAEDVGWETPTDELGLAVTSGTSGAILLAFMALLDPGDEVIIGDPFFVVYPAMGPLTGANVVHCDTYPDFRLTADRVAPLITERTKAVLVNSPGNPAGVVLSGAEMRALVELCESRGVLLISDEIYDEFTYDDAREDGRCPSPARFSRNVLLVRGFGKTYGCTGWRMGYAAGPAPLIREMIKLQQFTFVCAPSMAQEAMIGAFDVDMSVQVDDYRRRRDIVLDAFDGVASITHPGGAFYAFIPVPESLGVTATEFVTGAIDRNVLVIPGNVFSRRDTHFRLSYAAPVEKLEAGVSILRDMMRA